MFSRRLLGAVLVAALATTMAPPAAATHGTMHSWTGRVTHIADGDTFDIDLFGDGTSQVQRVRFAGIQTMESGQCHAAAAERSLARMINGKVVRLSAADPSHHAVASARTTSRRLLRFVDIKRDGRWIDVGLQQLARGHALWLPNGQEPSRHAAYHLAAVRASLAGRNLWNTEKCRPGPYSDLPLKMWMQSDAEGNDFNNVNGEWVKLQNTSDSVTLNLSGWRLRDAGHQHGIYRMPRGTKIPPGRTLTIHVGRGRDRALKKFWGLGQPLFDNLYGAHGYTGDGVYLFDRHLDHRAWFMYPCLGICTDPLLGKVEITTVNWDAPGGQPEPPNGEWVDITNISAGAIDLYGYLLHAQPYSYEFREGTVLAAGQTLKVFVGQGVDTALTKYWGKRFAIMTNERDSVALRTFDYIVLDCYRWGAGSCEDHNHLPR